MKTLKEQINEIKSSKMTISDKKKSLIELGLKEYELNIVLYSDKANKTQIVRHTTYTFGVEIECLVNKYDVLDNSNKNKISIAYENYNHDDGKKHFKFVHDSSIEGSNGIECVSPILKGSRGFNNLKKCCKTLNDSNAQVNKSTGLHVHIGAANLTDIEYCNVFRNYSKLEYVIDKFMAKSRRGNNNRFCHSLHGINFENINTKSNMARGLYYNRYYKVNAQSYHSHNTIEFRQHQGTTDFEKISNWVNFLIKLVDFSKKHVITTAIVTIDDIPFLTDSEKEYFKNRESELA